jgi:uncharacterized protein involved in outer membrane biogenesis
MAPRKVPTRWISFLLFAAVIGGVIVFWDWNWFRPLVEAQASQALGRDVKIGGLHVSLGRTTSVTFDDVVIANPVEFPDSPPFAQVGAISVQVDVMAYIHHEGIVIPTISLDHPKIAAVQEANGKANWNFALPEAKPNPSTPNITIGNLEISDGDAHFVSPPLKADFNVAVHTTSGDGVAGADGRIDATAKGHYAGQLLTGHFIGGTLLSLRDASKPYPVDLHIENGATRVDLVGTVQDPLKFAGAKLKLAFAGQDMAQLYPLTGIPIPQTPPFHVTGQLNLVGKTVEFTDFAGTVGSSDVEGNINFTPWSRPISVRARWT